MTFNILIWNARGVANKSTQSTIKFLIKTHKISIMAIIEPLINPKPDFFSRMFGLQFKGVNENGQIWRFAENGMEADDWDISEQVLHTRISSDLFPIPLHLSVVYGKCSREGRLPLWDKLRELAVRMEGRPWLVGGDFNVFLSEEERQGSSKNRVREMVDFANTISDCQLLDLDTDGAKFTWARRNIFEKLDRALIGEGWQDLFATTRVTNLPRIMSDHGPQLIQCQLPGPPIRPSFRFQSMRIRHHSFLNEVERCWSEPSGEKGMLNLQLKMGRVKKCLKWWNKNVFGNVFEKVKQADLAAQEAHKNYENDQSPSSRMEINRTATELVLI